MSKIYILVVMARDFYNERWSLEKKSPEISKECFAILY